VRLTGAEAPPTPFARAPDPGPALLALLGFLDAHYKSREEYRTKYRLSLSRGATSAEVMNNWSANGIICGSTGHVRALPLAPPTTDVLAYRSNGVERRLYKPLRIVLR
jgi:hypothetical protein